MDCLENISILHILLLIFLRICSIRNPMKRTGPLRFPKVLIFATWTIPVVVKLPHIFLWQNRYPFSIFMNIQFLILSTLPVFLILILYGVMKMTIKHKKQENREILSVSRFIQDKKTDRN